MGEKTNKEVEAKKTEPDPEPEPLDLDEMEKIAGGTAPYGYAPDGTILPPK